jgi:hypothetical protein
MALNTGITASLVLLTDPPPDAQCVTNLSEILQGAANYLTVEITNPAEVASDGSSIANQALNLANVALATAQETAASIPERRAATEPFSIPGGSPTVDSLLSLTWSPSMPDANYFVQVAFYGPAGTTGNYSWAVVDTSRTVDGCQIRLNNIPANFKLAWVVEDLQT